MRKCEACTKELGAGTQRFCDDACRAVAIERWRRGTPGSPGRTAAHRRRRRGR